MNVLKAAVNFLILYLSVTVLMVHREYIKEKLGDKAIFPPANALNSRASSVAALALDKAKRGETQSYLEMKPYYIRKSQAERELEERENKEKGESK